LDKYDKARSISKGMPGREKRISGMGSAKQAAILLNGKLLGLGRKFTTRGGKVFRVAFTSASNERNFLDYVERGDMCIITGKLKPDTDVIYVYKINIFIAKTIIYKRERDKERAEAWEGYNPVGGSRSGDKFKHPPIHIKVEKVHRKGFEDA